MKDIVIRGPRSYGRVRSSDIHLPLKMQPPRKVVRTGQFTRKTTDFHQPRRAPLQTRKYRGRVQDHLIHGGKTSENSLAGFKLDRKGTSNPVWLQQPRRTGYFGRLKPTLRESQSPPPAPEQLKAPKSGLIHGGPDNRPAFFTRVQGLVLHFFFTRVQPSFAH